MKNLSVGKKILTGFLAVILMIAIILALTVVTSLTRNNDLEQVNTMSALRRESNTMLQEFLLARAIERRPVLLVADDVQAARGTEFLEILRTLLNIENDGVKSLSILLVGQADMERRLIAASGFNSQLVMRAVLQPMTDDETRLYILARLKAAGSRQGIFTKHAADLIVKYSRGYPRQVNRLCEMALVIAFGLEENVISPDIVDMAAADLDLLPAGEASFFPWPHPVPAEEPEEEGKEEDEEDILAALPAEGDAKA